MGVSAFKLRHPVRWAAWPGEDEALLYDCGTADVFLVDQVTVTLVALLSEHESSTEEELVARCDETQGQPAAREALSLLRRLGLVIPHHSA